ncbi:MAG TPA: hypothetical protein RMI62_32865, partial [Polyangiaceae bacterium LLY-WYZ-15_(1-7)]|nr:hypothetical protein [Polyangiaceae bacterium LLY-WYZ-15_(1-7)]
MTPSFEIKGRALVTTLRLVERDVPGGLATLGLEDPDRAHFEGIFLASSWYPLAPYLRLVERLAALQRRPLREWMRDQARRTARLDVEKRDRAALAARDPEDMARRLPRAFNRYFR